MRRLLPALLWPCLILAGCLPAPRGGDGRLSLRVSWLDRSAWRTIEEIGAVNAVLIRQGLTIIESLVIDQANGAAAGTIEGLYAGEWKVKVDASMADGTVIYTGSQTVIVASGEATNVEMALNPAPGKLDVSLDVTPLTAAGFTVTEGKVYIYKQPDSGSSSSYGMLREGTDLRGLVGNLAPMTYDAKVAVPQLTGAIFISQYFQFSVLPGRTTSVRLDADGNVNVGITIIAEPGRVTGLNASLTGGQVVLTWNQVAGATGYRVYRTDGDGRFCQCGLVEGGMVSTYTDLEFDRAEPYGGAVRYAVAALAGPLEGIRSETVSVFTPKMIR